MEAVSGLRARPESLLMKWAGTVLNKTEEAQTVGAFKDGRLLLELLDRLWPGGGSAYAGLEPGPESVSNGSHARMPEGDDGQVQKLGLRGSLREATPAEQQEGALGLGVSPRTLAAKAKEAGVVVDVRTLEKVQEGNGEALCETLMSVYRPWIMQHGQKATRRVSIGRVSEGVRSPPELKQRSGGQEEADGVCKVPVQEVGSGVSKVGQQRGGEGDGNRAPSQEGGVVRTGAVVAGVAHGGLSAAEMLKNGAQGGVASPTRDGAANADVQINAETALAAPIEKQQPAKKARTNLLKRLNTKTKAAAKTDAGDQLGKVEELSQGLEERSDERRVPSANVSGGGEKDETPERPCRTSPSQRVASMVRQWEEKLGAAGPPAPSPRTSHDDLKPENTSSAIPSPRVQDKTMITQAKPDSETQAEKVPEKDLKPEAVLPKRSAYSSSEARLTSARAWLGAILQLAPHQQAHLNPKPPNPSDFSGGLAHVQVCQLLLGLDDTAFQSSQQQPVGPDAVSVTAVERRVAFIYDQLRVQGVKVSSLRPRKRSSGGAIDVNALDPETEVELAETLMTAAAELGVSVPAAVRRIRELTGVNEHPYDWEDALQLWINAVLADFHSRTPVEGGVLHGLLCIDDLLVDLSDGRALAVLLHCLSPALIEPRDIRLDCQLSRGETAHVIGLVQGAAQTAGIPFTLTAADLIYGHSGVKPALLFFLGAAFRHFEQKQALLPVVQRAEVRREEPPSKAPQIKNHLRQEQPSSKAPPAGSQPLTVPREEHSSKASQAESQPLTVRREEPSSKAPPAESQHSEGQPENAPSKLAAEESETTPEDSAVEASERQERVSSGASGRRSSAGWPLCRAPTPLESSVPVRPSSSRMERPATSLAEISTAGRNLGAVSEGLTTSKRAAANEVGSLDLNGKSESFMDSTAQLRPSPPAERPKKLDPSLANLLRNPSSKSSPGFLAPEERWSAGASPAEERSGRHFPVRKDDGDVISFVSALPTTSMTSEDARAVMQANLWALLNRAEENAATAAASLSLVRRSLSEGLLGASPGWENQVFGNQVLDGRVASEIADGEAAERKLRTADGTESDGPSSVTRPQVGGQETAGSKGGVSKSGRSSSASEGRPPSAGSGRSRRWSFSKRRSEATVLVAESRLEDADVVRIGETSALDLGSEEGGVTDSAVRTDQRTETEVPDRANPEGNNPDIRKRAKKFSLRMHPLRIEDSLDRPEGSGSRSPVGSAERNGSKRKTVRLTGGYSPGSSGRSSFQGYEWQDQLVGGNGSARRSSFDGSASPVGNGVPRVPTPPIARSPLISSRTSPESEPSRRNPLPPLNRPESSGSGAGSRSPAGSAERNGSQRKTVRLTGSYSPGSSGRSSFQGHEWQDQLVGGNSSTRRSSFDGSASAVCNGVPPLLTPPVARSNFISRRTSPESSPRDLLPPLNVAGGFSSPESSSPRPDQHSGRSTGPKSYRSTRGRVLLTERSTEARRSLELQFRLLEEQKAEADRKRIEERKNLDVRKSLEERRRAILRRSQEGFGALENGGAVLRVLSERLSRSREGKVADVVEAEDDVAGQSGLSSPGPVQASAVGKADEGFEPAPSSRVLGQGNGGVGDDVGLDADYAPQVKENGEELGLGHSRDLADLGLSESVRPVNASIETVERDPGERKEIDWSTFDLDSPPGLRDSAAAFSSDSESSEKRTSGELETSPSVAGGASERAVDWGALMERGLEVSTDVSGLDDSLESRAGEVGETTRGDATGVPRGDEEGEKMSKWDRRWNPDSIHVDFRRSEDASSEEPEAPSPADRYYKPNPAKPPKSVALNLIDRDDQEKRARAQLALDKKRELFLLERQLQQATVSKRRSTAKSVLDADVESGRRRSIDSPRNDAVSAELGSSRRRSVDLPRTESATERRSRRGSGVSRVSPFYAAPVRMSNKKLVRNALSTVCLAGGALRLERERALLALDSFDGDNFVILFKDDKGTKFKGLYVLSGDGKEIDRIYGSGPEALRSDGVTQFFKYDSGAKEFKPLQTQHFTTSTCAVAPSHRVASKRLSK